MANDPLHGIQPVDEYVGHRVRLRRQEVGISQSTLADAIGVTFQQVQKYERGANRISASTLVRIATRLDVTPGYLLDAAPGALRSAQPAGERPSEGLALLSGTLGSLNALRSLNALKGSRRRIAVAVLAALADRDELIDELVDEVADPA